MTGTISEKFRDKKSQVTSTPTITSLESVPFYADLKSLPQMAAMSLDWTGRTEETNYSQNWAMPLGAVLVGPMPRRFGIQLLRMADDCYVLNVIWDRTAMAWTGLTRLEIQESSLPELLLALGSDLDYMLEQPVMEEETSFHTNGLTVESVR